MWNSWLIWRLLSLLPLTSRVWLQFYQLLYETFTFPEFLNYSDTTFLIDFVFQHALIQWVFGVTMCFWSLYWYLLHFVQRCQSAWCISMRNWLLPYLLCNCECAETVTYICIMWPLLDEELRVVVCRLLIKMSLMQQ